MQHPDDIICQKFLKDPTINPKTNNSIHRHSKVYNILVSLCKERGYQVDEILELTTLEGNKLCKNENHSSHCIIYDKNNVPDKYFYKDPEKISGKALVTCSWCRKSIADSKERKKEKLEKKFPTLSGNKICSHISHNKQCELYDKNNVPIKYFYQDPENISGKELSRCKWCRDYFTGLLQIKNNKSRELTNEIINKNDIKIKFCDNGMHTSSGSPYPREQVPLEFFKKDNEDINDDTFKSCFYCRQYQTVQRKEIRKKAKEKLIPDNMFLCGTCFKLNPINEQIENFDGTKSKSCADCKTSAINYKKKIKKLYRLLQLNTVINNEACCLLCGIIILKGPNDGLPLTMLETKCVNNVRMVKYEEITYNSKDFLVKFSDQIEVRVLEFDHLSENEQRKKGLLLDNEIYTPKKSNVCNAGNESAMKLESKKCQLICKKCHVKETIRREEEKEEKIITSFVEREIRITQKQIIKDRKALGCEICKYVNIDLPRFFDFDHLDPTTKLENIAAMVHLNYSTNLIEQEMNKCRVLFKNCHHIHTITEVSNKIIRKRKLIDKNLRNEEWNIKY